MAKLDYYCIHTEADTETGFVNTDFEANFICPDHVTVLECYGLHDSADLSKLAATAKRLFEDEIECTYEVKQSLDSFAHTVAIFGNLDAPSYSFSCDGIKVIEHEEY